MPNGLEFRPFRVYYFICKLLRSASASASASLPFPIRMPMLLRVRNCVCRLRAAALFWLVPGRAGKLQQAFALLLWTGCVGNVVLVLN